MKKQLLHLGFTLFVGIFAGKIMAQNPETPSLQATQKATANPPKINRLILKTSVFGFIEPATTFQLDAEMGVTKNISLVGIGGYYQNILWRNTSLPDTYFYKGWRYGGEFRYYFLTETNLVRAYIGLSVLNNESRVGTAAYARILEGAFVTEKYIPLTFEQDRLYAHLIAGYQIRGKRVCLDFYGGAGVLKNTVKAVHYDDTNSVLVPVQQSGFFPSLIALQIPDYENNFTYFDLNLFFKIGYILN